ncbi:MAG: HIT domain-containing protein [Cyanobacteria bacterium]|nr:HIT domain-containing protein [Cyanobacteriota bacterium]
MEYLWTPWRFSYVTGLDRPTGCVFCMLIKEDSDEKNLIVHRAEHNFVIMNLFPYSNGHVMVLPYAHLASLTDLDEATTTEMMELCKRIQRVLEVEYKPNGFNVGFNLGKCAGAGIAEHLHMHIVPRWIGDANFVSVIGETRMMPEDLLSSYNKIAKHFAD